MDILSLPAGRLRGPAPPTAEEIAAYVVAAAVWAPSVHNTQPWWFSAARQEISLFADAGRQLRVADPCGREMMISCGAALFTARLALRSLGYIPETSVLPDPGRPLLVARVSWQRRAAATEYEQRLFSQVLRRRTHRGGFDPLPLSPSLLAALQAGAERDRATLRIIADEGNRAVLAAVVETAERALRLDSAYVRELARWAPPPGSSRCDGVPHTAYPARSERIFPYFPGRDFAHGRGWGLSLSIPSAAPRSAGVVCLLATAGDRPLDWVNAGQALQRALLTSATCGVAAALHSQPLERARLREFIRTQLGDGSYPQLVLRFGTAIQTAVSVRRRPASVLFASGGGHLGISHG
jgi:nitroreductase